jgi:thiamine kinase-like enzyme
LQTANGSYSILVREASPEAFKRSEMYIIDWEYTQLGHRAYDLGQMIADLLERDHFAKSELALPLMKAVIEGYGTMSEHLAYRTAIHAGTHMIGWYTRRNPTAPLPAPMDVAEEFMKMAVEMVVKGWNRDISWFERSQLRSLFVESFSR